MDILVYLFKNRIHEYLNINSFKNEESDEMSADSAHVQGASGGESTNSPVVSSSYSPDYWHSSMYFVPQLLSLSQTLLNR